MGRSISRREILASGLTAASTAVLAQRLSAADEKSEAADKAARKAAGALTVESLGTLLEAIGLKPTKFESRYDFSFTYKQEEEWNHTMSAVLSADEKTLWIMAWLDELPKTAADVPRTSLLRLLADNDKMGNGIFFAYVQTVRKFILQRVIANEHVTTASFKADLKELASKVVDMYAHWNVANWKQLGTPATQEKEAVDDGKQASSPPALLPSSRPAAKTATKESPAPAKK